MTPQDGLIERRLVAILAADIAAYSRLMNVNETETFHGLTSHRKAMDALILQHGGRIANSAGDSVLAEFPSVVAAIQCAVDVQNELAVENRRRPEEQWLVFRIGVHVGEVLVRSGDMFGHAVNLAARIEGLAVPGGICISGDAYRHAQRAMPRLRFVDLGEHPVKNLQEPVHAYSVVSSDVPGQSSLLTVSMSPNFAAKWLIPRLSGFVGAHPKIDLKIAASLHHVDFMREGVDLAIRHGEGHWPSLHVTRLCNEVLFPVCSPTLLSGLRRPDDLRKHTLLHLDAHHDWRRWLDATGTKGVDLSHGVVFNQDSLAIDAAIGGQGVALSRSALVSFDLLLGRLVRPFAQSLPISYGYFVVCPMAKAQQPEIAAFRGWLLECARDDEVRLAKLWASAVIK